MPSSFGYPNNESIEDNKKNETHCPFLNINYLHFPIGIIIGRCVIGSLIILLFKP